MGGAGAEGYFLNSPQGSIYNLASWIRVEDGPDFGDSWLEQHYTENAEFDGGQFAYESAGVRTMSFPLLVASYNHGPAASGLMQYEAMLRAAVRPGGYIDIQAAGVPTAEAVRFNVLGGRVKPDYRLREQAISFRRLTVEIDVQRFGYWPTDIIIASTASMGLPGQITVDTTKLIGDVPGLGILRFIPTTPTTYSLGTWYPDTAFWSLGGGASFAAVIPAASLGITNVSYQGAGTLTADSFAYASQAREIVGAVSWGKNAAAGIGSAVAADYQGRFRIWALARLTPSQGLPFYVSADAVPYADEGRKLASAAPIATLPQSGGASPAASPAYHLLDLGEVSLPPIASGLIQDTIIRVWTAAATSALPVPTPYVRLGALVLQPVDPAGLVVDELGTATWQADFGDLKEVVIDGAHRVAYAGDVDNDSPARELHYVGVMPQAGASARWLTLGPLGLRKAFDPKTPSWSRSAYAPVSLTYRPRFGFLKGI